VALAGPGSSADALPLLVIVPRHPQRFDEVARLIEARGWRVSRRSRDRWNAPPAADTVLLGDSMNELARYYGLADVTLMGGSFGPFGSQNLIESCSCGTPVIIGPSTYNFSAAAAQAIEAGAALQVSHVQDAVAVLHALAGDPARMARMRAAAQAFAQAHRGATAATVARVLLLAQRAGAPASPAAPAVADAAAMPAAPAAAAAPAAPPAPTASAGG
jgi:3-deoxy-D-manno-octulosonic-acid transferase